MPCKVGGERAPAVERRAPPNDEASTPVICPNSRPVAGSQAIDASQAQLDTPPADPIAFRAHARGLMKASFDERLPLARTATWVGGAS